MDSCTLKRHARSVLTSSCLVRAPVPARPAAMATHTCFFFFIPLFFFSFLLLPGSRTVPDSRSFSSPFHFVRIHYGNKAKRSRAPTRWRNPFSPVDGQKSRFKNKKQKKKRKKKQQPTTSTKSKQCSLMYVQFYILKAFVLSKPCMFLL